MTEFFIEFFRGLLQTGWLEFIAVLAGIASVWFSRVENILVYPVGLVNTLIYVYLSVQAQLFGEASVNLYYSIMSVYGWWWWSRRNEKKELKARVTYADAREWLMILSLCGGLYLLILLALRYLKESFAPGVIPAADAFASATAFTGMWLMTRKKLESWYFWILTNIVSIPLYYVKGFAFTSVYYLVLLVLAVLGLLEWRRRAERVH